MKKKQQKHKICRKTFLDFTLKSMPSCFMTSMRSTNLSPGMEGVCNQLFQICGLIGLSISVSLTSGDSRVAIEKCIDFVF